MRKRGSCGDEWLAPQRSARPEMGRVRREGDRLCVGRCREVQLRGLLSTEDRLQAIDAIPPALAKWLFQSFISRTQLGVDHLIKGLHFRRVKALLPVKSCNHLASKPLKSHTCLHLCGHPVVSQSLLVSCSVERSQM